MTRATLKIENITRKDKVTLINGTTGTVFSTGTLKAIVITDDGRTLAVTPDQIRILKTVKVI